jgi:hypothetical protein
MSMAIDRQDGRHFCDPWDHPDAPGVVVCECGKVWALNGDSVYEAVAAVPILPEEQQQPPADEERADEVDV